MGYIEEIRRKIGHDRLLVVGAGVFVHQDRRVLLTRRADNGMWCMPGGGVEPGECVEMAARRELFEETGLIAGELTLLGVFSGEGMDYTYPNGDMVSIVAVDFVCAEHTGTLRPQAGEVTEARWFDVDALPEDISPPDRGPLAAFVAYLRAL